jgi:uncharacterized delta-60 repeat protein
MKKSINLIASALVLSTFLTLPVVSLAQDGSLDLTFDSDGIVTTSFGNHSTGSSVLLQSDGKIVVAGHGFVGTDSDFALTRYNTNGSLDTTFDTDGKVTTDFGNADDLGLSAAIQSDGKILLTGYSYNNVSTNFALARYNTNGSLDTTFDADGKVTTTFGGSAFIGQCVAVQSNGKIVVGGYAVIATHREFALVRCNTNGSLDSTFDGDGKVTTAFGTTSDEAHAIAIQSDGKIVAAGVAGNNSTIEDFALVRYNMDGSQDTTFDSDGVVTTAIGVGNIGNSVAIQADGKIVVAGRCDPGNNIDFAVARYNTNGSLDSTFDGDGKVTTNIGIWNDIGYSVAIQSDGKIVVAGSAYNEFGLVRYNINGSLDTIFDSDGMVTTAIGTLQDDARAIAIQSDGKIVVAGYSRVGSTFVFALARYNNTIPVGINETDNLTIEIKIYPNPFSSSTTIQTDKILDNAILSIYNIYGQQVKQLNNLSGQTIILYRDNLSSGVYFIQLTQENKIVLTNKLVIAD